MPWTFQILRESKIGRTFFWWQRSSTYSDLVRETGLEPVRCEPHAPQTCASASSATPALTFIAFFRKLYYFTTFHSVCQALFWKKPAVTTFFSRFFSFPQIYRRNRDNTPFFSPGFSADTFPLRIAGISCSNVFFRGGFLRAAMLRIRPSAHCRSLFSSFFLSLQTSLSFASFVCIWKSRFRFKSFLPMWS